MLLGLLALALVDSINPSAIVVTLYLLSGGRMAAQIVVYVAAIFLTYLTLGVMMMSGIDALLPSLGAVGSGRLRFIVQGLIGLAMLLYAFMILAAVFSTVILGQAGEELGWRGYALPRLAERFGMGLASVLLGVIWAVWHLPQFFIPGSGSDGQSFPLYLVHVTALSVAIGWLYWKSAASLFMVMVMHASINNTAGRSVVFARLDSEAA